MPRKLRPIESVSSEVLQSVPPQIPLMRSRVSITKGRNFLSTASLRVERPSAYRIPRVPVSRFPGSYIPPDRAYRLNRESDGRWYIIGTNPAPKKARLARKAEETGYFRIFDTTPWPWCVQGHAIATYPNGKVGFGSGTMAGKHHVLTAGHLVYSHENGGWATSIQFNPAQNDGLLPFGTVWATRMFTFVGWKDEQRRGYDIAMMILNQDIGVQIGYIGLIQQTTSKLEDHKFTISAYPADRGARQQWARTGTITGAATSVVQHDMHSTFGDSGAGMYSTWPGVELEHQAATHVATVADDDHSPRIGCRIGYDKFPVILDWLKA